MLLDWIHTLSIGYLFDSTVGAAAPVLFFHKTLLADDESH